MKKYRAAIVGCGGRSPAFANTHQYIDRAELVACCSLDKEQTEKTAERYGIRGYGDAALMIETEKPDLVHLVTPPRTRVELMTLVSALGVPACTVEKPIAIGVRDWKALSDLERTTKTKFGVSHQFRWQPHLVKCREAIESGELGKPLFVDASAGLTITDQGTHSLHYGNSLNGDRQVVRVFGAISGWGNDEYHPGPVNSVGYITFDNGVRMLWNTGPTAPVCGDPEMSYQHVRAAAYAERGRVLWEEFGKWEIVGPNGVQSGDYGGREEWRANNIKAQTAFHEEMIDWLEDDSKPAGTNLKRSLHEWKAVLALYASSLTRSPIIMDEFDPTECKPLVELCASFGR